MVAKAPAYGLAGLSEAFPPGFNPAGDFPAAPPLQIDVPQFGGMQPPTRGPAPAPVSSGDLPATPFDGLFAQAETQYRLPPGLLKSMANVESQFNPNATSPKGARGIMQFMPQTAARFGIAGRETDPAASIDAAGRYMQAHMNMFGGDIVKAIAAYNAGEGNVQKAGGIPAFPETQAYVPKVLAGFDNPLRGGGPAASAPASLPAEGGFVAAAKRAMGQGLKGAGQLAGDLPIISDDNALKRYGQSVIDANPAAVNSLSDIAEQPWMATKEATGNAGASIGAMVGMRAAGQAITAAAPLTGPLAPATALLGQAVAWLGPAAIAALPSYGGIREKQILDNPANNDDFKSMAIAGMGAATVGAIEQRFGPQNWALAAMTKEGRNALAEKFAETTLAKGVGYGALKGGAVEGAEELVQNPIEQLASYGNPTTAENVQDTLFSGAMGAIGGGVLGGGFGGALRGGQREGMATQTPEAEPAPAPEDAADPMDPAAFMAQQNALRQANAPFVEEQNFRAGLGRVASANDAAISAADINPVTGQPHTATPGQSYDMFSFDPRDALRDPQLRTEPEDPTRNRRQMELNLDPTNPDILYGTDAAVSAGKTFNQLPITDDIRPGNTPGVGEAPVQEAPTWQTQVKAAFTQAKSKATKTLNTITAMETPDAAAAVIRDKYSATGDRAPMKNTMAALNAAHTALTGVDVETYDKQQATPAAPVEKAVPPAAKALTKENRNGVTPGIQTLPQEGRNAEGQADQGPREERVGQGKAGGVRQAQEKGQALTAEQRKNNPLALLTPDARVKAMMVIQDVLGWDNEGRPDGRKPMSQAAAAAKRGVSRAAINKVFAKLGLDKDKITRLLASGAAADAVDLSELMPSQGESVRETGDDTASGTGFSIVKNPNEYHVNEAASAGMSDEERKIAQKNRADTKAADEWAAAQGAALPTIKDTAETEVQTATEQARAEETTSKVRTEATAGAIAEWAKVLQGKEATAAAADWDAMSNLPEGDIAPMFELLPINDAADWVSVYTDLVASEADWAEFEAAHKEALEELPHGNRDIPSVKELADAARSQESGAPKRVTRVVQKTRSRSQGEAGDHRPAQGAVTAPAVYRDPVTRQWHWDETGYVNPAPSQAGHVGTYLGDTKPEALKELEARLDRIRALRRTSDTPLYAIRQDGVGAPDAAETQFTIGGAKTVGLALKLLRPTIDAAWHPIIDKLLAHPTVAAARLELTHADAVAETSGRPVLGQYFTKANRVELHNGAGLMALLHEATHARTHAALRTNANFRHEVNGLYESAKKQTLAAGGDAKAYGFKNLDEFVAEIYGNAKFSNAMNELKVGGESLLTKFKNLIRKLLGLSVEQQSIVDAVVDAVDAADSVAQNTTTEETAPLAQEVVLDKFAGNPPAPGRTAFMDKMHDFAIDLIGDKGKAWGMNFMTMRDLKDTFGKRLPSLAAYVDTMLTMGADSHATALEYAKVQEEMLSLKSKDTQSKLLDLMTDSTQAGIHPDKAVDDKWNNHVTDKAAWAKLHAQWSALGASPDGKKAQDAYIAARELFRKNWEKRLDLLEEKVKAVGMDAKELAKWKASTAAWSKKLQGPYFPLTRFGDWVSVWKSPELVAAEAAGEGKKIAELKQSGKHYKVAFMDSMTASKRLAAQWGEAGGKSYSQKRVEFATSSSTVDKVFLDKIESQLTLTLGTGKEGKAAVAAMKELYAYTMPDLSIMKRTLARRGVDGVDAKEMLRSFSRAGMADAFYMARLKYADKAVDHLQALRKEDGPDEGGDHSVLAHMIKLHSASLQKVDTPIQSALANASYITMLGASPAFLTINAMQPWMISLPVMGGRHGTLKTAKALQSAYPDAMGLFKALWGDQGWRFSIDMDSAAAKKAFAGKDGERLMLKHLLERGIIDIGIENDLRAVSEGQEAGTNKYVKAFTAPAQYVETINRVTTALASYRLEMAETKGDDTKARGYAEKMVADTQLDYSAANAPYLMRPGVVPGGRLLFQFRKYQQGMLALLIKQLGTAMKGEIPEARKEAKNALFGLLATHMTMTGLAGLPIAFPLGALATMIAQAWDDDDEPQPDIWWNNFLADYFGTTAAKVVNGGLPTLLGMDMQRMGLGNITSPMPYVKPKGTLKESFQETMLNLAPAEGLLTNWFAGVDSFSKGDWAKGLSQVMPKAFADPIKAMKLADDGLRTARGNPVFSADDISGGELAMKAAGFQPAKLSTYYKAKSATEDYRLKALSVRDDLVNRWVESKGDPDARAAVMEDIQGYRERHKGQKGVDLTYAQLHKALVADAKFARSTTASGITVNRGEQWKRDMTRFAE